MAEELCTCCDLPLYSCGRAIEERRRQDERAVRQRALQEPGVVPAKWTGTCTCGTPYDVGAPIRKTPDGWANVICCPDE